MSRLPLRAGLAALVVALVSTSATPSSAASMEYTAVGFANAVSAYLNVTYRPPVNDIVGRTARELLQAECLYYATGGGSLTTGGEPVEEETVVFVAKVVTTAQSSANNVLDRLPAATGIVCELWDGLETMVDSWDALRPGSAAYNTFTTEMTDVAQPRICGYAYVLFGDTSRLDGPRACW